MGSSRAGELDDRHLPDAPDACDPAALERREGRVDGLQRDHAGREGRLHLGVPQGRSQPAGGDLDLGQLGHASKPREYADRDR